MLFCYRRSRTSSLDVPGHRPHWAAERPLPTWVMMEDKRKKRSPKVSLPQPPPPPINPRKLSVLPASKSATFSLGLPQPPSPKNRGKYKRSIGAPGQPKEVFTATVVAPPKTTRCVCVQCGKCPTNFTTKFRWKGPDQAWTCLNMCEQLSTQSCAGIVYLLR